MFSLQLQGDVDRSTIEEYVELEKQIASHESQRLVVKNKNKWLRIQMQTYKISFSPALILQQKRNQLVHLDERIKQQEENLEALGEQT